MAMNAADDAQIPEEYANDVEVSFYDKSRMLGRLAGTPSFHIMVMLVTTLYLIWMGVETDFDASVSLYGSAPLFQVVHQSVTVFFTTEAVVRFCALRNKGQILKCPFLIWDIILVLLLHLKGADIVLPNPKLRILWLLDCLQLSRGVRMAYFFLWELRKADKGPEMAKKSTMTKILSAPGKAIFQASLITMNLLYTFTIVMRRLTCDTGTGNKYFDSVSLGMSKFLDVPGITNALLADGLVGAFVLYLVFLLPVVVMLVLLVIIFVSGIKRTRNQARATLLTDSSNLLTDSSISNDAGNCDAPKDDDTQE